MTTTKSYLAGLGMTGIVIGSVLVLLAVGTGLVAFDGARDVGGERAPLDRVVVGKGARSAGAQRGHKRPDVHPAPATARRLPVARPPAATQAAPGTARSPETARGREAGRRAEHGHGGVQARTPGSLGGGAPVRDASEDGGGAAADGPPGRARRGAGPPPGHGGDPASSKETAPSKDSAPGKDPGRVGGQGRSLGPGLGLGHVKHDVGNAVDRAVPPGLLP
jgi:hypothetical protein